VTLSSRLFLFATPPDYAELLTGVEARIEVKYLPRNLFIPASVRFYPEWSAIQDLGISPDGDTLNVSYLVVLRGAEESVTSRVYPGGEVGYEHGTEREMPGSVVFYPGGLFRDGSVVEGTVTSLDNPISKLIFSAFRREAKRRFEKIDMAWVGPDAARRFSSGARLTQRIKAPVEYDLRRH
jgi:hypothetical protein